LRDHLRFGVFYAPFHPIDRNPTLQLRRDIEMADHLDELGFDEVWFGEHHSQGIEIVGSPELMLAAIAERTSRIKLGVGVASLPWHHPMILADRMCQLDHQSRGRLILGTGPGRTPLDSYMMDTDQSEQGRMQDESLSVLLPMLRGEVVSKETDWFKLRDARLQLLPYNPEGIEVVAASTVSPSGSVLAGKHGLSLLSLAAGDEAGFDTLDTNWRIYEKVCAEHGHDADRNRWRLVSTIFLAETREEAYRAVSRRILQVMAIYAEKHRSTSFEWARSPEKAIEAWIRGEAVWSAVIGTPEDAIAKIQSFKDKTGGFGTYLINAWDLASYADTKRSFELFASEVFPVFQGSNSARIASLDFLGEHGSQFQSEMSAARARASSEFYGSESPAQTPVQPQIPIT
jgi:limonene 1,2-monooxygenase